MDDSNQEANIKPRTRELPASINAISPPLLKTGFSLSATEFLLSILGAGGFSLCPGYPGNSWGPPRPPVLRGLPVTTARAPLLLSDLHTRSSVGH